MAAPVVKVEVEFTAGAWTDVSSFVMFSRSITMTAGRSDTDERVQPGRLSGLTLRNNDGRFTVGNAAGAYYPNVTSGKRVRVSVQDPVSSTYVPRFTGRIDGWPLSWGPNGTPCTVTVSATDMLRLMQTPVTPVQWYAANCEHYSVTRYWPMTDNTADRTHVELLAGDGSMTPGGSDATVCNAVGPGSSGDLPHGGTSVGWTSPKLTGPTSTKKWTAKCLFKSTYKTAAYVPLRVTGATLGSQVGIYITTSGEIRAAYNTGGGAWTTAGTSGLDICDGNWWTISVGVSVSSATTIDVSAVRENPLDDGVSYPGAFESATGLTAAQCLNDGQSLWVSAGQLSNVGHVTYVVNNDGAYFNAAPGGWALQWMASDYAYFDPKQICDIVAGLTVTYSMPAGFSVPVYMSKSPLTGSVYDLWGQIETADRGGVLYCEGDGTPTYLDSRWKTHPTDTVLTLAAGDVNPSVNVAADGLKMVTKVTATVMDRSLIMSQAVVGSGDGGIVVTAYGRQLDDSGESTAARLLADSLYAPTEAPRIPTLPLDPLTMSSAHQAAVLATGIWDQIGITGLPTAGGWDTKWLGRVEGWTETVGATQWDITYNTSFAGNRLGDATHGLILGSNRLG